MQYGQFPRMKHACNAAMPVACTVRKQQLTVTLLDCNHLAQVIVLLHIKIFMCDGTVFALCDFVIEGNFQVQVLPVIIFRGAI